MAVLTELRLAPAVQAMEAFLEPHRPWAELVLECSLDEAIRLEMDAPFGELVVAELLKGAPLDRSCLARGDALRAAVSRWEIPPHHSPRVELHLSRIRTAPLLEQSLAWDPHWKECPVGIWLKGLGHALIAVQIPFVSFQQGSPTANWQTWVFVNRSEAAAALALLRSLLATPQQNYMTVFGGRSIALSPTEYDWHSVVLDPEVGRILRVDFETFLEREPWFRRHKFPFRRGYLLYGPPGNGKTSAVRVMASHPALTPMTIDLSKEDVSNEQLTQLFESAGQQAPSLVIFEDLDRLFGKENTGNNKSHITFQHLLNCLDGLVSQDGVIVVATANDPKSLDAAILRRPGRFDRSVFFAPPTEALRADYLARLGNRTLDHETIEWAAKHSDGFSFAQVRESYILAGQLAFERGDEEVAGQDLRQAVTLIAGESHTLRDRASGRSAGFESIQTSPLREDNGAQPLEGVVLGNSRR